MSFDVPFKNVVVVPEAHLPIVHYKFIDGIGFGFIRVHIEALYVFLHEDRVFANILSDKGILFLPIIFVLIESLQISGLFCVLNLLFFMQTLEHSCSVDGCIEGSFRIHCLVERILHGN